MLRATIYQFNTVNDEAHAVGTVEAHGGEVTFSNADVELLTQELLMEDPNGVPITPADGPVFVAMLPEYIRGAYSWVELSSDVV